MKTAKDAKMAHDNETLPLLTKSEGLEEMAGEFLGCKNDEPVFLAEIDTTPQRAALSVSSVGLIVFGLHLGINHLVGWGTFLWDPGFSEIASILLGFMFFVSGLGVLGTLHKIPDAKKHTAQVLADKLCQWAGELRQTVDAFNFRAEEWNAYLMRLATNPHEERDPDHEMVHSALVEALELIEADMAKFEAELATRAVEDKRKRLERNGQIENIDLHDRIEELGETERDSLARFSARREVGGKDMLRSGRQTARLELVRDELDGKRRAGAAHQARNVS